MAPIRRSALTEFILAAFLMFGQIGVPAQAQAQGKVSFNPDAVTYITTCGTTISTPGTYALSGSLTCTYDGVDITSSDVTLKLYGYQLYGPCFGGCTSGQTGIRVYDPAGHSIHNVRIIGGTIEQFLNGVWFQGVRDSDIIGLNVIYTTNGFVLDNSTRGDPSQHDVFSANYLYCGGGGIEGNAISDSKFIGNQIQFLFNLVPAIGLQILNGTGNVLTGNRVTSETVGIQLGGTGSVGATGNVLVSNTTQGNYTGILVGPGADGNSFRGNSATGSNTIDINEENAGCGTDIWDRNAFVTASQTCVQ